MDYIPKAKGALYDYTPSWIFFSIKLWRFYRWVEHVSGDLLLYINEDPLGKTERYTILWLLHQITQDRRRHTNMSTHKAAGQTAVGNIWRGQTPTCQCLSMLCLHFSRESTLLKRCINPASRCRATTLQKHIWPRFLPVPASSSSAAGLCSLCVFSRKYHTSRKHRISILSCTH